MFNRQHKKLFVRDDNGVLRVLIDDSVIDGVGMNEEEAISQEHAVKDIGIIQKDLKEKIDTGWTTKTTIDTIGELAKQTLKNAQNQEVFDKNLQLHYQVLRDISTNINKLGEKVEKLNEVIKKK
jgi:hypothetical protein